MIGFTKAYIIGSEYDRGNMDAYDLPWPIDEASIGEQCGYVYRWDGHEEEYTKIPVYDYLPLSVEAVKVTTNKAGNSCYITFLAYPETDSNEKIMLSDHLSEFYGLTGADDIASVYIDTGYTDIGIVSKNIDVPSSIEAFYYAICGLSGQWYSVIDEPDGPVYYVTVKLTNGLQVFLLYYPDNNCFGTGNILYEFSNTVNNELLDLFEIAD